jgi:hypothetical protein
MVSSGELSRAGKIFVETLQAGETSQGVCNGRIVSMHSTTVSPCIEAVFTERTNVEYLRVAAPSEESTRLSAAHLPGEGFWPESFSVRSGA